MPITTRYIRLRYFWQRSSATELSKRHQAGIDAQHLEKFATSGVEGRSADSAQVSRRPALRANRPNAARLPTPPTYRPASGQNLRTQARAKGAMQCYCPL